MTTIGVPNWSSVVAVAMVNCQIFRIERRHGAFEARHQWPGRVDGPQPIRRFQVERGELEPAPRTSFIAVTTGIREHTERGTRNVAGFEDAALPHIESVGRFALALTRKQADADDLVQETFLRAFRGWHTFSPGTDCRRWLFTICRNTFIGWKRRDRVYVESHDEDIDATPAAVTHMQAAREELTDVFDRIDVRPAIESAVRALPEPHRSILVLVDLEDMTYEDAAGVLEIPLGTVRSRLYRARRHVQEALLEHARDFGIGAAAREVRCCP